MDDESAYRTSPSVLRWRLKGNALIDHGLKSVQRASTANRASRDRLPSQELQLSHGRGIGISDRWMWSALE